MTGSQICRCGPERDENDTLRAGFLSLVCRRPPPEACEVGNVSRRSGEDMFAQRSFLPKHHTWTFIYVMIDLQQIEANGFFAGQEERDAHVP